VTTTRSLGRPRDASIDEAILLATWEELSRVGYPALTMTSVAEKAGIQKPALYRRWPSKPLLVIDALARHLPPLTAADHGSLQADLEHVLGQVAEAWRSPAARAMVPLLSDVGSDEAAADALAEHLLRPRSGVLRAVLARSVSRGELSADAPIDVIGNLLEGPLLHRAIFGSGVLDDRLLDSVLTSCLTLLKAHS
jgi:AcrR family transcriptional regulator